LLWCRGARYTIDFTASDTVVAVTADTIYGAMAAMETFSQLFSVSAPGQLVSSACHIADYPSYAHRGFLVDSGRRFVPVALLKDMMNSMAFSKVGLALAEHCVASRLLPCARPCTGTGRVRAPELRRAVRSVPRS
jgi:hypothetical protein